MSFFQKIKKIFSSNYKNNSLSKFCEMGEKTISDMMNGKEKGRIPGVYSSEEYKSLEKKYKNIPKNGTNPKDLIKNIIKDFTRGTPLWRSPYLQYNVGAAVNKVASSIYGLALDLNIFNINSGLAGNTLAAEKIVANLLAKLANVDLKKSHGIFTFGGTATNLYALKISINKSLPTSPVKGVSKKIRFLITEDSHSCHAISSDWLGIGTDKLLVIPAKKDRTSNLKKAKQLAKEVLSEGKVLAGIIINGGTTYDNAIDNIKRFKELRDTLVKDYKLKYTPHLHVDSVIGWAWLMFSNYDFSENPLEISQKALKNIQKQYHRIRQIKFADSWGVDFHKGIGGAPIPCSIFMVNNKKDFLHLAKNKNKLTKTHHVAGEFSFDNPSNYTLETSRPGGAALAALASLYALGQNGFQKYLSNLIESVIYFRELMKKEKTIITTNPYSLGYVTMLSIIPPNKKNIQNFNDLIYKCNEKEINLINRYTKKFFKWDKKSRADKKLRNVYSCSSSYIKTRSGKSISGLKFYPVSPFFNKQRSEEMFKVLKNQKKKFDKDVWHKK